jgi:hypothetical protein
MQRGIMAMSLFVGALMVAVAASAEDKTKPASTWLGTWQAAGKEDCKELRCAAKHVEGENWQATFTGVCSREFCFEVKMNGVRKGDKIVFAGETDLGEQNGGVYNWAGEIVGDKFTGKYTSTAGKDGTFEMKPAPAPPASE